MSVSTSGEGGQFICHLQGGCEAIRPLDVLSRIVLQFSKHCSHHCESERIHTELLLWARPYARLGPRFVTLYACYHQRQPASIPALMHQETAAPRKQTLTRMSVRAGFPCTLLSLLPSSPAIHAARGAGLFKNLKLKGTVSGNCYESRERNLMLGEKFSWHFLKILIENLFKHPGLSSRW